MKSSLMTRRYQHFPAFTLVELMIRRTRRYEIALLNERRNVLRSGLGHRAVMAALERGDLPQACAALRKNLQTGKAPIAAWLKRRNKEHWR